MARVSKTVRDMRCELQDLQMQKNVCLYQSERATQQESKRMIFRAGCFDVEMKRLKRRMFGVGMAERGIVAAALCLPRLIGFSDACTDAAWNAACKRTHEMVNCGRRVYS